MYKIAIYPVDSVIDSLNNRAQMYTLLCFFYHLCSGPPEENMCLASLRYFRNCCYVFDVS